MLPPMATDASSATQAARTGDRDAKREIVLNLKNIFRILLVNARSGRLRVRLSSE